MIPSPPHRRSEAEPPSTASSPPPSPARPPLVRFFCRRNRQLSGGSTPADPIPTPTPTNSDPPVQKKTRDLPNLTECHACGFRIDVCNGKRRLQTLYSEWRIVLLCRKCLILVESSRICSYCFGEAEAGLECLCCGDCKRSVHRHCFYEYRSIAPWSYSCSGLGSGSFSVCVDCWVPKSLISAGRVSKSRRIGEKWEGVRVSDDDESDGKCNVEKKVVVVLALRARARARAREMVVKKAVVVRKAVNLGSNELGLVDERDVDGGKVVDDAQLAIRLHRAMNSSPRISKNLHSVSLSRLGAPRMLRYVGDSSARGSDDSGSPSVCGKLEAHTNNKLNENPDKSVSETSVCAKALDDVVDVTDCAKDDDPCPENCNTNARDENGNVDVPLKEGEGSCSNKLMNSFGDDNSMGSESHPDRNAGDCNEMPDRYLIKYSKRRADSNNIVGCKRKFLYEGFQLESQASDAGALLNCSKESRTFSNSSFQSCAVPFQTPFHGSGSAREQS